MFQIFSFNSKAFLRYSGPGLARGVYGQFERSQKMFPIDNCVLREEKVMNDDHRCFDSGDLLRRGEGTSVVHNWIFEDY